MRVPGSSRQNYHSQEADGERPRNTMARQEANEQFQLTSFLDGANAAYIEQLYARYEEDPDVGYGEWQSFFKALQDKPNDVKKAAKGASWQEAELADRSQVANWSRRSTATGARSRRSSKPR